MMVVFELEFDLFDHLMQGRIKEYSTGFQKGELKALFVGWARQNVSACLFLREYWSHFEAGLMAVLAPLSNLVFLLFKQ